jgi:hypothetical protein
LKNAVLAFFNLAKCGAKLRTKAQNSPGPGLFCHRIHAMTQPAEFFNELLKRPRFAVQIGRIAWFGAVVFCGCSWIWPRKAGLSAGLGATRRGKPAGWSAAYWV